MLVPTLQRLAVATLIRFRDALGDIGYVPVELLQDVLAACSPQQLAAIEDETLAGTGRTLKPWTWPLWREHWQKQFASSFGTPAPGALPPLPPAAEVAQGEPGVRPADYRALYELCQAELEQKRAESGARLRALREQAQQERQARHTQVVDPGTVPGRRRRQQQRPGPASSGGGGGSGHRFHTQPAQSSKERLLKKLGLGGGSSSSRPAALQPRKTVTVIRPARTLTTAGMPQRLASSAQQALPSPSALRHAMPPGLPRSPAGSLASPGSSPLAWQQVQAARSGSTPLRQQLQAASSSPLAWQQVQAARSGSTPLRQQLQAASSSQPGQQPAQRQQSKVQHQQQLSTQQPAQRQHTQQQPCLPTKEAGMKPQVVASSGKASIVADCHSELLPSRRAERPQQQALPMPPPQQQQPSKQSGQAAAAAAVQRKAARPTKPQALEEVDLFAGVEEAPLPPQPQRPAQPAMQPQQKRALGSGSSSRGKGSGSSRGAQPVAKKPRQQQPATALLEVDLFDGL